MPEPIVPAPITATLLTSAIAYLFENLKWPDIVMTPVIGDESISVHMLRRPSARAMRCLRIPLPQLRPDVVRQRPDDAIIRVLLHHVRAPASHAAGDENRRVLRHGNAHHEVRHAAREIHVWKDVLLLEHD